MAGTTKGAIADLPENLREELLGVGRDLWDRPEPGFFENRTHDYLAGKFSDIGFAVETFDGMPGFIARSAPTAAGTPESDGRIAAIADMDDLPKPI